MFHQGKVCIERRDEEDIQEQLDKMDQKVGQAIDDLQRRIGDIYSRVALSKGSRKYVKKRFKKECLPYATFYMGELTFRSNLSVIASAPHRQRAMATVLRLQDIVSALTQNSIVDVSLDGGIRA